VIELLLNREPKADPKHLDKDGDTPLQHSNDPAIRALLKEGKLVSTAVCSKYLAQALV